MRNQTNFHLKKMMSLGEWKEKVSEFIKHSIIDIIRFRINSKACENSYSLENEFEHISHDSYKINTKEEKKTEIVGGKADRNKFQESFNEYRDLEANEIRNTLGKNLEDPLRNKIIEKISDGFLYLNFSDLNNFQQDAMEYIITISILFRRKDIKFVVENWVFEVNLMDEINQEITRARKFQKQINLDGFNLQRRIYIHKKLDMLSKTIKSLLNFLPSIKLFHGNSFDFYLDFEINFEEINKKDQGHETKNDKNSNAFENIQTNNNENLGVDEDEANKFKNEIEIFQTNNSFKLKANQEITKENTNIPIQKQIELIRCLTNSKRIFHNYKTSYVDKIGKMKIFIEYLDKYDVFLIEEEINKSISHLERINKRKRFLSENSNEQISKAINNVNTTQTQNTNENKRGQIPDELLILKNSFLIESNNNSPKIKVNDRLSRESSYKIHSNDNENNMININFPNLDQDNINNNNNGANKTTRLFENIIPNCSINNQDKSEEKSKGDKRISSKSEEKNHSKNSPENNLTTNEGMIINFTIRDYLNENSPKNSTDYLNSERTISTKSSNYNNTQNYFCEENKATKDKALASLQMLKNQLEEIHKIPKDDSISSSSYEESVDESDESSIELVIEGEMEHKEISETMNLNQFIIKMNKIKSLLNNNYTMEINKQNFDAFKNNRLCIGNKI